MSSVNIYLTFSGNCEQAFEFYKQAFKKEYQYIGRFGEMPPQEGMPEMSEEQKSLIMHVNLLISGETCLMGSDCIPGCGPAMVVGNNYSISINAESKSEADRLFGELSEGGVVTMPLADTFWGAYFGMFTDKFGINWMVNFDQQQKE